MSGTKKKIIHQKIRASRKTSSPVHRLMPSPSLSTILPWLRSTVDLVPVLVGLQSRDDDGGLAPQQVIDRSGLTVS